MVAGSAGGREFPTRDTQVRAVGTPGMDRWDFSTDAEAFGVLGNETRLDVLAAVWVYWAREHEPVPYSTLKETVGVADSGRFNYHLDKLRGRFVTEKHGGYVPEIQGIKAISTLISGQYRPVEEAFEPVEGHCPICGGGMQVGYHWDFYVGCGNCWEPHLYRTVEPAALEQRDWRELFLAANRARRHRLAALRDGACPDCGGRTGFRFHRLVDPLEDVPTTMTEIAASTYCTACMLGYSDNVGEFLHHHPEVRAYSEDHGIDLDAKPFWCHEWVLTDLTTVVHSEDPWRVEKVATVDGCRLAAVFADDGCVETVTHVDL